VIAHEHGHVREPQWPDADRERDLRRLVHDAEVELARRKERVAYTQARRRLRMNGAIVMRMVVIMGSACGLMWMTKKRRAHVPLGDCYTGYVAIGDNEWG
jgi:hypothetical protein